MHFSTVISWLEESLNFAINVFITFVNGSYFGMFMTFFIIFLVTRLIIVPLVGSALPSDTVKPIRSHYDDGRGRQRGRGLTYEQERELYRRDHSNSRYSRRR